MLHRRGLFPDDLLRRMGAPSGNRYIARLKLQRLEQGAKERVGALGIRILETKYAHLRLLPLERAARDLLARLP